MGLLPAQKSVGGLDRAHARGRQRISKRVWRHVFELADNDVLTLFGSVSFDDRLSRTSKTGGVAGFGVCKWRARGAKSRGAVDRC